MATCKIQSIKINVENLLFSADMLKGILTYPSDIKGIGYAASEEELLIITDNRGYLRINVDDIDNIVAEITSIAESVRERRRW